MRYIGEETGTKADFDKNLINLDQGKAFDRFDHHYQEAVFKATGFGQRYLLSGQSKYPFICHLSLLCAYSLATATEVGRIKGYPFRTGICKKLFAFANDVTVTVSASF